MRRFNDSENVNVSEEMKMQEQINLVPHLCQVWRFTIL